MIKAKLLKFRWMVAAAVVLLWWITLHARQTNETGIGNSIFALMSQADYNNAKDAGLVKPSVQLSNDSLTTVGLERVRKYFASNLTSRYMEQDCEPATYPGWEGFPLIKCRYQVKDSNGTQKSATVIMLNPSPEQLARWVVHTCLEVKGSVEKRYTDKLSKHIIDQSGAQLPVAGIVFEDMLPKDGIYEIFCFRNGVTVRIRGIKHLSTLQPTNEEIERSLNGEIISTFVYARLQSTTREQYRANGGTVDVGSSASGQRKAAWLEVSRQLYQAAWGHDRNELMIAWARENL